MYCAKSNNLYRPFIASINLEEAQIFSIEVKTELRTFGK